MQAIFRLLRRVGPVTDGLVDVACRRVERTQELLEIRKDVVPVAVTGGGIEDVAAELDPPRPRPLEHPGDGRRDVGGCPDVLK